MIKNQTGVLWSFDHRSIVAINQILRYINSRYEAEWAAFADDGVGGVVADGAGAD